MKIKAPRYQVDKIYVRFFCRKYKTELMTFVREEVHRETCLFVAGKREGVEIPIFPKLTYTQRGPNKMPGGLSVETDWMTC